MTRTLRRNGPPPGGFVCLNTPPKRTRTSRKAAPQPSLPPQPSSVAAAGLEAVISETNGTSRTGGSPAAIPRSPAQNLSPAQDDISFGSNYQLPVAPTPLQYSSPKEPDTIDRELFRDLDPLFALPHPFSPSSPLRSSAGWAASTQQSSSSEPSPIPVRRPSSRHITSEYHLKSPSPQTQVSTDSIARAEQFSSIGLNNSYERVGSVTPTSKMNASFKRGRDDDDDEEPTGKRQRQQQSHAQSSTPTPTTPSQPTGGFLGSISRLSSSIGKKLFWSAPAQIDSASNFASHEQENVESTPSSVSKPPSRLSSLFDQEPVRSPPNKRSPPSVLGSRPQYSSDEPRQYTSLFSTNARSPLTPRPNIARTRNGTPATRKRPPTPQEIIAANPNYTPRTPEQNKEILHRLRNPPELASIQNSSNVENIPPNSVDLSTTLAKTSPSSTKKRKHSPGPGFSMAAAYLTDGEEGYKDYYGSDSDSDEDDEPRNDGIAHSADRNRWTSSQAQTTFTPVSRKILQIGEQTTSTPTNGNTSLTISETSAPRTAFRNGQPRSALKKPPSIAPTDGERSAKRVKFGSPIEQPQTLPPPPRRVGLARNRKFGAYNMFLDNELSQATEHSQVIENSQITENSQSSDISEFSDNSLNRETYTNTVTNTPHKYSQLQSVQGFTSHTPLTPPSQNIFLLENSAKTPEAQEPEAQDFTPRPHNPTPGTFCLPDDFGDTSESSLSDDSIQPTVTKDLTPAFDRARAEALKHKPIKPSRLSEVSRVPTPTMPTETWDFGKPQTYVEAGIIGQEALDIVNQNWNEDDSEDAGLFFKRGFARYCKQIDEYEAKGLQIEVDC